MQYDEAGDYLEAFKYALKTSNHIPSHHFLANLLFINPCGIPPQQRYLLCLHWLQIDTHLPTINVRSFLLKKVLNLLQNREDYNPLAEVNQTAQIEQLLKGKENLIQEAVEVLAYNLKLWTLEEITTNGDVKTECLNFLELKPLHPYTLSYWKDTLEAMSLDNPGIYQDLCEKIIDQQEKVLLLASKCMLFFSANSLPKEAQKLVQANCMKLM